MKAAATSTILALVFFAASCVQSLNPLYTEQDLTFDDSLVGVWVEKETNETWALTAAGKLEYALVHTDSDGRKGEYSARLVKLNDRLFLDIVPVKPGFVQNDFYKGHYFATHRFVNIVSREHSVQVSYLEPKWVKEYLAENPDAIRSASLGGELLFTASSREIQKFLLAHLNTRGAFSQPSELVRKRGAS